jgi:hypothetical protein
VPCLVLSRRQNAPADHTEPAPVKMAVEAA